jgi:hypothetical protein
LISWNARFVAVAVLLADHAFLRHGRNELFHRELRWRHFHMN